MFVANHGLVASQVKATSGPMTYLAMEDRLLAVAVRRKGLPQSTGDVESSPFIKSGRGPEDFDGALGSGSAGQPVVTGEQGGVHCFGECHIRRVIDGEVVAQFPAPGQQRAVRRTLGWQRREVIQRQACAAAVECAGSDLPPEY